MRTAQGSVLVRLSGTACTWCSALCPGTRIRGSATRDGTGLLCADVVVVAVGDSVSGELTAIQRMTCAQDDLAEGQG